VTGRFVAYWTLPYTRHTSDGPETGNCLCTLQGNAWLLIRHNDDNIALSGNICGFGYANWQTKLNKIWEGGSAS
jgi:hypothetical protein